MNHHPHTSHGLVAFAFVAAIAFAFGLRAARVAVGAVLVVGALVLAYIMFRIVAGTI